MSVDTAFYAGGVVLPGPSSLPASTQMPSWTVAGAFAGWVTATAPAGSGTELQYRNGTAFGAVTDSSVSGGNIKIGTGTPAVGPGAVLHIVADELQVIPLITLTSHGGTQGNLGSVSATGGWSMASLAVGVASSGDGTLNVRSNTGGTVYFDQATADTDAFDLNFRKARGTVVSPTVITTGDDLGTITAYGYSGTPLVYVAAAQIRFHSEGTVATTRVGGKLVFATATDAAPSVLTDRMTINSAGLANFVGAVTLASATGTYPTVTLGGSPNSDHGCRFVLIGSNASTNWEISQNYHTGSCLQFTPSTTGGGSTFTTPRYTFTSTGMGIGTTSGGGAMLTITSSNSATPGEIINGATNHSVALLQLNMTGTPTGNAFEINLPGGSGGDALKLSVGGTLTVGTDLIANRDFVLAAARYIYWSSRSTLSSASDGVVRFSNQADNDFNRIQLGGTTALFPSIKRSGATLAFRLADDSADCAISCASITLADAANIVLNTTTGTQIATAVGQKLAFHGSAAVIQRAGAAQAAVATTGATNVAPYGYTTAAQADAIITLLNELRAAVVEKGLIKGAA